MTSGCGHELRFLVVRNRHLDDSMPTSSTKAGIERPCLIPVLDLLGGAVVRGVAGERMHYRPIVSRIVDTPDPLSVAEAIQDTYGLRHFYVADLDGIQHDRPNWNVFDQLLQAGFELSVDAGVRSPAQAKQLVDCGVQTVVAALETSEGPETLRAMVAACGPERLAFSLDLKAGHPLLRESSSWAGRDPLSIAEVVHAADVSTLIVLDLVGVGGGGGLSTLPLCREVTARYPGVAVWTGGGVRDGGDVAAAAAAGVSGLMVASALHAGGFSTHCI